MPSSLSAHLLEQFYTARQARAPFGRPLTPSQLMRSGPMSYAPNMHGSFSFQQPFLDQSTNMSSAEAASFTLYADIAESTAQKIATLQAKLDKKLGPEYISQRPGPGGGMKLTYAEGWKIINLANEVFGFNGWSSSIVNLNTDFIDYSEETKKYNVGVSAVIRVTLRDGVYHEDIGYGMLENSKSKGAALDKCKKEAVTDGVKRALRNFGNLLGNCLYDKQYAQEIVKMKVPPPKFDKNTLHRRPEFQEGNSASPDKPNTSANTNIKPTVPFVIPKAIGMNSYTSANASGTSNSSTSKPVSTVPSQSRPVATSTPLRDARSRGASVVRKEETSSNLQKPQAPGNATSSYEPNVNSVQIVTTSNQAPKNSIPAQQLKARPRAIQELERADTYSFSSDDDDEFLAALNQAEEEAICSELAADMGRPIGVCEGIGSAIDFEEGTAYGHEDMAISPSSSGDEKTLVDSRAVGGISKPEHALQRSNNLGQTNGKPVISSQPHQPTPPVPPVRRGIMQPREIAASKLSPKGSTDDEIARQIIVMRQQRKAAMTISTTAASDENALSKTAHNIPGPAIKPRTASMGGFNFPPGMKPGASPLSSAVRQSQAVSVQAGVKRTADSMQTTRSNGRSVSYANAQASQTTRQPFTRLDDSDGGDVKRIRK